MDGYELCINHQLVTGSRGWNAVNIVLSYRDHIGRMLILFCNKEHVNVLWETYFYTNTEL